MKDWGGEMGIFGNESEIKLYNEKMMEWSERRGKKISTKREIWTTESIESDRNKDDGKNGKYNDQKEEFERLRALIEHKQKDAVLII